MAAIARSWLRSAHLSRSARVISSSSPISVGLLEHLLAGERVAQAVLDHRVERLDVAHAEALARAGQQVGRLRHRLHAAADRDLEVAGAHRLVEHPDRAHARRAHLVDRLRGDLDRDAGLDLRLAGRDLALARLQHRAHHDVLDLLGRDVGALQAPRGWRRRPDAWPGASTGPRPACRSACGRCSGSRFEAWAESINVRAPCDVTATTDAPPADGRRHDRRRGLRGRGHRARPRRRAAGAGGLRRGQARAAQAGGDARRRAALHRRRARRARGLRPRAGARGRGGRRSGARRSSGARGALLGGARTTSPTRTRAALVEGTLLAAYTLPRVQERRRTTIAGAGRAGALRAPRRERAAAASAAIVAEAANAARDLQNRPANDLTPTALAERARRARGRDRRRARPRRRSRRRAWARSPASRSGSRRGAAADHDPLRAGRRHRPAARASSARR